MARPACQRPTCPSFELLNLHNMAFFKFRKKIVDEPLATTPQTESVEMMRRRAKHRLLGAAVLVLLGVVGFPLLFDQQPRPIPVDISIEIPDKNKVKPLNIPPPVVPAASAAVSYTHLRAHETGRNLVC